MLTNIECFVEHMLAYVVVELDKEIERIPSSSENGGSSRVIEIFQYHVDLEGRKSVRDAATCRALNCGEGFLDINGICDLKTLQVRKQTKAEKTILFPTSRIASFLRVM